MFMVGFGLVVGSIALSENPTAVTIQNAKERTGEAWSRVNFRGRQKEESAAKQARAGLPVNRNKKEGEEREGEQQQGPR